MYRSSTVALAILLAVSAIAQEPPPKPWNSTLGAGLAITSGNSDTQNINLSAGTAWDPKTNQLFKAEALYLRGENDGEKQVDKASAIGRYERTASDRIFWFGELSYLRDPFKAISYLVSPIAGAGYHLIATETRKLSLDGGAGAVIESNEGLGRNTSGAIKAGESFDWAISPSSKFTQRLNGLWKTDDFDDALYHFDVGLSTTIAARAELKLSYLYDYKNKPSVASVKKGDSALFAAVVYKF
jgi:putative salt-induced outer membrane protein YdiY